MEFHPKEKHCLPTTDETELQGRVGSWRWKLVQNPTEEGSEVISDIFIISWAMPVAAGAAVGQELSTVVIP